jgi:protein-S-isoprenylcysteine O-methyltransferase Ste14
MVARIQFGQSFAVGAYARSLVTRSLYAKFRHPIYHFGGLAFAGLFIAWGHLIGVLNIVLVIPVQILRIRKEETVLEQAFGEEYCRYRASTWF